MRYSDFLAKNNMFEPSWIIPDFSSVGKKFVVIYPELLDDYADYIDIFSKTEDFIIVNLPEFEENENVQIVLHFQIPEKNCAE